MNQHDSRKIALQAIYLYNQDPSLTAGELESNVKSALDLTDVPAYSQELIAGVIDKQAELREKLSANLKQGWRLERLSKTTLAILEVALYEMLYSTVIEDRSAINEALNLCDEFDDPKAKAFINGILANFVQE
ncbi:N utilization substance protein B [Lactobacillus nasalidis]|uniref:N utilization substance protein B n=1 Tax=Lactobacillus nasalidis TaxID=2797258 RepID=A0ABQ3W5M7_9LACO|nr:transcription antitermination factor NusB [Lactobacillus nasalidis]GHV97246.1 N utilization substance protein B [Lactobacillus nasalidis]GHW00060.1 N utilization substance protein B [Lactobacillus nasalidis]GHW00645.1 N utilization substance protein B [Lactobacillus nasalidis]